MKTLIALLNMIALVLTLVLPTTGFAAESGKRHSSTVRDADCGADPILLTLAPGETFLMTDVTVASNNTEAAWFTLLASSNFPAWIVALVPPRSTFTQSFTTPIEIPFTGDGRVKIQCSAIPQVVPPTLSVTASGILQTTK